MPLNLVFHIGYHKTGTSWLQQSYLPSHPEVALASDSAKPWNDPVLRYLVTTHDGHFNSETLRKLIKDRINDNENVVSVFSAERLSGHPVSGGYDAFNIARRIYQATPEAKIFYVVRDQLKAIESMYKELAAEGYLGSARFMLSEPQWRIPKFSLQHYEYDLLLSHYISLFGSKQICVLRHELMCSNLEAFLRRMCHFFEITYKKPSRADKTINRSLPNRSIPAVRFLNHFRRTEMNPFPLFRLPYIIQKSLIKMMRRIPDSDSVFNDEIRSTIAEHFEQPNKRLQQLLAHLDIGNMQSIFIENQSVALNRENGQ